MNYRESVQRVLSLHHARLEMGLAKAREQEIFACHIGRVLARNKIGFKWRLTHDFDVEFMIHIDNFLTLKQLFDPEQLQADDGHSWVISSNILDGVEVRVILEEM